MNPDPGFPEQATAGLARERAAPLSVAELNRAVARALERGFPLVLVRGEISNFTRAASGHWYFSLKDDAAQVRCAMFRGRAQYADFVPREGDAVELRAQVKLYEPKGDYQLVVDAIRRAGAGGLLEAFNRLKEKLAREGLFDADRKRALPAFVRTIGIVTSTEAAALRDVAATLAARAPHVRAIVYPTPVQGEGAARRIAAAIARANARRARDGLDLLIVCRGGGSIEDLWAFNEEIVARAIAASELPVICGVGHETDVTIADFAADLRAPTPTGAAQLAVRAREDWLAELRNLGRHLARAAGRRWEQSALRLDAAAARLASPARRLDAFGERIAALAWRARTAVQGRLAAAQARLAVARSRRARERPDLAAHAAGFDRLAVRLRAASARRLEADAARLAHLSGVLDAVSPAATLRRGYAIVTRDARLVATVDGVRAGDAIAVRLADGTLDATVEHVRARDADLRD